MTQLKKKFLEMLNFMMKIKLRKNLKTYQKIIFGQTVCLVQFVIKICLKKEITLEK